MNFKNKHLAEAVDHIDAAIYSGGSMYDPDDRKELRKFLERWGEAITDDKWIIEGPTLKEKILNASNIHKIEWDKTNLIIHFKNAVYQYFDIPEKISVELGNAESPGAYLHRNIKGNYRYEKIE